MMKIKPETLKKLTEQVKKQLNVEYSDEDTDTELEGKVAACVQSLMLGGMSEKQIEDISPLLVQTVKIMVLDLSEETPGFAKLSSAANYFALQMQLGVDGNG